VRYDIYRASVKSDVLSRAGDVSAATLSPSLRLAAGDFFLTVGRGLGAEARALATMLDPRSGAPVARLDPAAKLNSVEIGYKRRLPFGIETKVSMFRARSDLEVLLTGENAITEFSRPTVRQGVQLAAQYEPIRGLTLDFLGTAMRARFGDGASEYIPGAAERLGSVTATLHPLPGWSTSVGLSHLGPRTGIDGATQIGSATYANAGIARSLSKDTRVSLDFLNVFDRPLHDVDYFSASRLANQVEPRGVRLRLRTTF
jgi:outer membrane receptor protein involved in Fe transport